MSETEGMNVTEAAAFLRLHRTTVSRLVKQGTIPHRMVGTAPRFSRTALTRWLAGEEAPTTPTAAPMPLPGTVGWQGAYGTPTPTAAPMTPHPRLKPKNIRRPVAHLDTWNPISRAARDGK